MKIAILGDTHFGVRGDAYEFHKYFSKFYENVFFPFLKENEITTIVQLGDLFDRRKFINFNSLYLCRKYFFDKLSEHNIRLITLLGNHDVSYKNTLSVNSSSLLLDGYANIEVIDEFTTVDFNGTLVDIVPWLCDENEQDIFEKVKESKSQVCFGHFEIDGFEMDRGNVHVGGLDRKKLSKYDVVLSGHFHHKSSADNISYTGTPYEMTWADYNDPKGFYLFDTETREIEFIINPFKMFHKVYYDDGEQNFEYWKNYDYETLKETFVKIVVLNKQNPYMFDVVVDNLYKASVSDISIVEDFVDSTIDDDQELVNQAEDTMTILGKYIDNLTLNVDSDKLKKVMREIYIESLDTQKTE